MPSISFWLAAAGFSLRIAADHVFLGRLMAREPAAVTELVRRHHAALVSLARTIVKDSGAAEDVAQETWIAVMANIESFDGRAALSTWIISILMNKARTHLRKQKRYVSFDAEAGEAHGPLVDPDRFAANGHWAEPPVPLDGLSPERIVMGRELWRTVRERIETLPAGQRAVLIMRDVEGRDAEETCSLLEISAENQRVLLHRARANIRNFLETLAAEQRIPAIAKA